jgi:hypothetical protein
MLRIVRFQAGTDIFLYTIVSNSALRSIHHPYAAGTDGSFHKVKKPERETNTPTFTAGVIQSWKYIPTHVMCFHGEVIRHRLTLPVVPECSGFH